MEKTTSPVNKPQLKKSKFDDMFTLVKDKEGVKIAIGNYQISKKVFEKFSEADAYIAKKPYEILINATCLFTNLQMQENENKKTNSKAQ